MSKESLSALPVNQPEKVTDATPESTQEVSQLSADNTKKLGERVLNSIDNYEYPQIISTVEAKSLIGEAPCNSYLYDSMEDIISHSPEQLKPAMNYLDYMYDEAVRDSEGGFDNSEIVTLYATIASYMDYPDIYDRNLILEGLENSKRAAYSQQIKGKFYLDGRYGYVDDIVTDLFPDTYTPDEEAIPLSSYLHLLHQLNPELRNESVRVEQELIEKLAEYKGIDLNLRSDNLYLPVPEGEFLTGKDAFPEYLQQMIEQKLASFRGDLGINYHVSWGYSHLDNGDDYTYNMCESPYIDITAKNPISLEKATKIIDSITPEEVQAAFDNYRQETK